MGCMTGWRSWGEKWQWQGHNQNKKINHKCQKCLSPLSKARGGIPYTSGHRPREPPVPFPWDLTLCHSFPGMAPREWVISAAVGRMRKVVIHPFAANSRPDWLVWRRWLIPAVGAQWALCIRAVVVERSFWWHRVVQGVWWRKDISALTDPLWTLLPCLRISYGISIPSE